MHDVDKLAAQFGLSRAPGESDAGLWGRTLLVLDSRPSGLVTTRDYAQAAGEASRWVRRVRVRADSARPYEVIVEVRGPLRLPVPSRVRSRVQAKLHDESPAITRVEVR